ncbi:MAG: rhodanese-like domain-containing protein [Gammaproteobacteria bacterium]|nr:rhodanese-like domain-containing protein [Gammaproteobacteria bacterium]
MQSKSYREIVAECAQQVNEIFPWDLIAAQEGGKEYLLIDIRCPSEFQVMHIENSTNVPRGILEMACDFGYEETVPELVRSREKAILLICRSGNRSILAAHTMQLMGFREVISLKTGLRGWSDYELPLVFSNGLPVKQEIADRYFEPDVSPEQQGLEPAQGATGRGVVTR